LPQLAELEEEELREEPEEELRLEEEELRELKLLLLLDLLLEFME